MWRRRDRCEHTACLRLAKLARRRGDCAGASRWFKLADGYLRHDIRQDAWIGNAHANDAARTLAAETAEAELETIRSQRAASRQRQNVRDDYRNLIDGMAEAMRQAGGGSPHD